MVDCGWTRTSTFAGGMLNSLQVVWRQLWLIYFGYGFVGGTGLGLGYISPVSTLIKRFPDRPGPASGMAIMGFGGGGAMIGSPLAIKLMAHFRNAHDVGVGKTFLVMGVLYFPDDDVWRLHDSSPKWGLETRELDRTIQRAKTRHNT
jgi:MFS family permease